MQEFTRFSTIADGNCLIHAILRAAYPDYINSQNDSYRRDLARQFRELMAEYILKIDSAYPDDISVANLVKEYFKTDSTRNFKEFLRAMYKYETKELEYNKDDSDEKEIDEKILTLKKNLEDKLDYKLYLPNNFNEGVIEAILNDTEIPEGIYSEIPANTRLFTFCGGANLIKLDYEYNKMQDVLYLRHIPSYFRSRDFIGDADVLSYIPDIMEINIIIIDLESKKLISAYETSKTDKYVIINNIGNVHYETVGHLKDGTLQLIFAKEDKIISDILRN